MADQNVRNYLLVEAQGILLQLESLDLATQSDQFTEARSAALRQATLNMARLVDSVRQGFVEEFKDEIPLSRPFYKVFTPQVRVYYVNQQLDSAYQYLARLPEGFEDRILALRNGYSYFMSAVCNLEQVVNNF